MAADHTAQLEALLHNYQLLKEDLHQQQADQRKSLEQQCSEASRRRDLEALMIVDNAPCRPRVLGHHSSSVTKGQLDEFTVTSLTGKSDLQVMQLRLWAGTTKIVTFNGPITTLPASSLPLLAPAASHPPNPLTDNTPPNPNVFNQLHAVDHATVQVTPPVQARHTVTFTAPVHPTPAVGASTGASTPTTAQFTVNTNRLPTLDQLSPYHVNAMQDFVRWGFLTPPGVTAPTPVTLQNRFNLLTPSDTVDLSIDMTTPPPALLTPQNTQFLHTTTTVPYSSGKTSSMFPLTGFKASKSLAGLPKFTPWDPDRADQVVGPKAWMLRFTQYCFLQGNWHLPAYLPYFLKGSAVTWYDQLVRQFDLTPDLELTAEIVELKFLQQYHTSLLTDAEIARAKLYSKLVTMHHYPVYYNYEQAFMSIVQECGDLAMSDQLQWFLQGLTPDLHIAVCLQPLTNLKWVDLESCMAYTRGHMMRFALTPPTPSFAFHAATPQASFLSQQEHDAAAARGRVNPPQESQGPQKIARISKGRGDKDTGQVRGRGGGRGGGRSGGRTAQPAFAVMGTTDTPRRTSAQQTLWVAKRNLEIGARINKSCPPDLLWAPNTPFTKKNLYLMRMDTFFPRCHTPGHVDLDTAGVSTCSKPATASWPEGEYKGFNREGIILPSRNALSALAALNLV